MNIVICGNYGAGNVGDELILKGLLKTLYSIRSDLHVSVLSGNPRETRDLHSGGKGQFQQIEAVSMIPSGVRSWLKSPITLPKTFAALKKADLILFGGGGLFNEGEPYSVYLWGTHARWFARLKKKYIIIGQSFTTPHQEKTKKILQEIIASAETICVRDEVSREILQKISSSKTEIEVTTDLAFSLTQEDFEEMQNHEGERSMRSPLEIITVLRKYRDMNITHLQDQLHAQLQPRLEMHEKITAIPFEGKVTKQRLENLWYRFANARGIIAMRLHAFILAILTQTPHLALSYHDKIKNLASKFHDEAVLEIPCTDQALQDKIQQLFKKDISKQDQLREILEKEQENVKKHQRLLTKFIK